MIPSQEHGAPSFIRIIFILLLGLGASNAVAQFSPSRRSINGTGETLAEGEFEVSPAAVSYGIEPDLMLRVPSLLMLVGYGRFEGRFRHDLGNQMRLSPYVFLETPRHGGLGSDVGWDWGEGQQHSVTVGGRWRYGPLATVKEDGGPRRSSRGTWRPNAEYDRYVNGNVAFVGMSDYLVYAGFTWAWTSFHCGVVMSPASGLVPLPYIYWRF